MRQPMNLQQEIEPPKNREWTHFELFKYTQTRENRKEQ